jgi:2-dehydro-3-deoxyphosphogluconate aldolase/(4S)-4-hydroxy-2-oxoglutarate aldolase
MKRDDVPCFLGRRPVIPVLTINDAANAVPLARALAEGGLDVIEVTLRTRAALDAIRRVRGEIPAVTVGAGTVLEAAQIDQSIAAGAQFLVSPGATSRLLQAARQAPIPFLPGAGSVSDAMELLERGYRFQKLFPAAQVGGIGFLKAIAGPIPEVGFCPTGGIGQENAAEFLAQQNVVCVGGSWPAPEAKIAAGDWDGITALARSASALADTRSG